MNRRHRVWAEVDLDAVAANFREIARRLDPSVRILAVVKADAYGHGAVAVARRLLAEGAHGFGVGDASEGLELREAGITSPILILGAIVPGEAPAVVSAGLSVSLFSRRMARLLDREGRSASRTVNVHLKLDTGMGRLGVYPEEAAEVARVAMNLHALRVVGAFTHCPASDAELVLGQARAFSEFLTTLPDSGSALIYRHMASSSILFQHPYSHFDMVRPGIALYGVDPGNLRQAGARLRPALSMRTQIVFIKEVPAGAFIGYRPGYKTYRPTKIATIPIGYADGYSTQLSGKARVIVRGHEALVVGRISMDYTTIDVGHVPDVREGDVVTLLGRDGEQEVTATSLAMTMNTIPYEVCTMLSSRRVVKVHGGGRMPV